MRIRSLSIIACRTAIFAVLLAAFVPAQRASEQAAADAAGREFLAQRSAAIAETLLDWGRAFDAGHLLLQDKARLDVTDRIYGPVLSGAAAPLRGREGVTTHFSALQQLLFQAEQCPTVEVARAVLPLAAAGFEGRLYDVDVMQVRDLGHWTLMRMESNAVWSFLQRVAAGEAVAWMQRASEPETLDPSSQVAAVRLLGTRGSPVFRPTIEQRLSAGDPRIRLAAAESLQHMGPARSLPILQRALGSEQHPVVTQALLHAIDRILRSAEAVTVEERERAAESVVRLLGRVDWRTDLTAVDLLQKHPIKAAIPALIGILGRATGDDKLVEAVNAQATPLLRHRTWEVLCALTGTILPVDDPSAWRRFWEREKDRIVLVDPSRRQKIQARTRSTFYDIPVIGGEIAFLIDTSGSMNEPAGRETEVADDRRRPSSVKSRLDAAKDQILAAVQAMDAQARYHLLTFDSDAQAWNRKPVPPSATRSLTETLGKFEADGGTNVHAALAEILGAGQLSFGKDSDNTIEELFVLSDGEPTVGVKDPETILRLVREWNRYQKVRINTVFTGVGRGAEFMRRLAEENDGVFVLR